MEFSGSVTTILYNCFMIFHFLHMIQHQHGLQLSLHDKSVDYSLSRGYPSVIFSHHREPMHLLGLTCSLVKSFTHYMKFISPTWAATQRKYTTSIKDDKKTILILIILILMIVMIGIVRYQVPVIKQLNTETSSLINMHIEKNDISEQQLLMNC